MVELIKDWTKNYKSIKLLFQPTGHYFSIQLAFHFYGWRSWILGLTVDPNQIRLDYLYLTITLWHSLKDDTDIEF